MQNNMIEVTVPDNAQPGQTFSIDTPSGPMMVTVPEGNAPGSKFPVMLPAAADCAKEPVKACVVETPAVDVAQATVTSTDPNVPFGAAPGGIWRTEQYSGMVTLIIFVVLILIGGLLFCWAPFCCPCDSRQVYVAPNGQKHTRSGAVVPSSECCGHPCGGPGY